MPNGQVQLGPSKLLSEMTSHENGIIVGVKNEDPLLLQHLDKINIRLGLHIEVTEVNDFDQSMQVKLARFRYDVSFRKNYFSNINCKKFMTLHLN